MAPPGKRILIVEDEFFIALVVEEALQSAGYVTVGPIATLSKAIVAADTAEFDAAVLDINLNGEMAYPVAEKLLARGKRLVFTTGYGLHDMPARFRSLPVVAKPFLANRLVDAISKILGAG